MDNSQLLNEQAKKLRQLAHTLESATAYQTNGQNRLRVSIEAAPATVNTTTTLAPATMRPTIGGDLQFGLPMRASETLTDPVDRFRVSQPQSMIDTDFEYGTQPTKWETINMTNYRPYATYNVQTPLAVTAISSTAGSRVISVTTGTSINAGTPVFIQDATFEGANGLFTANTTGTTFTYTAAFPAPTTGSILNSNVTAVYQGQIYTGAAIGGTPTFGWSSGLAIPVTTTVPHGLALGNEIVVTGSSQANANGAWIVARIVSETQFIYYSSIAPAANPTGGQIFARPVGSVLHRAFDGGVKFSSNASSANEMLVRQTRKYFRYQSGKGVMMSTGSIMKPSFNPDLITSSGTTVTVNTKEAHNLQFGASITVAGCIETAYNGTFTVTGVITPTRFTYTAGSVPSAASASGQYQVNVNSWVGSTVRIGMYDDQNGLFFEFDGTNLFAVRRASTYQISGSGVVSNGGTTVTGTGSEYSTQLSPNDMVVIKGQSYKVCRVISDTQFTINPAYRGPSIVAPSYAFVTKTIDTKIPQSAWNIDRMNGAGGTVNPSGFNLDLSKMQMFYIDYSWYGAGPIRWGFRGANGAVTYCHKLANNNVNLEAYMRTGNLPARYETSTVPVATRISASIGAGDTTINVVDASAFPNSGIIVVNNGSTIEHMNYTGKTTNTFTGVTRARAGEPAGIAVTIAIGSVVGTVASSANLQVGQRVVSSAFPDGTYVVGVSGTTITFAYAATALNPTGVIFSPMSATTGQAFTFNVNAPIGVEFGGPTAAPIISHWGSSVIMDGRFDEDKQFIFTTGTTTSLSVPTLGNRFALMSIRLAPSVSSGLTGAFGIREIINRMQLSLFSIGIYAQGNYLVSLVLNGTVSSADTWTNVGGSSLAQVCFHGAARTMVGGEVVGGFYVNSGGTTFGTSTYDLRQIRDLSNSILGGGTTTVNTQFYPDGPDILTVVVQALTTGTSSVFGRLSWTEAQA
jgi:hypothetical protein